MKTLLPLALSLGVLMNVVPSFAQTPVPDAAPVPRMAPNAVEFTLANGMQVAVIPDHRAPVVTHMVWYRVGAADETGGQSGIAHFLEHLMFKGTQANPGEVFRQRVAAIGGDENAFTSADYTAYFQRVAKENLGEMMRFEADRMTGLVLTDEMVATERDVVLNERRDRVEKNPDAELGEALLRVLTSIIPMDGRSSAGTTRSRALTARPRWTSTSAITPPIMPCWSSPAMSSRPKCAGSPRRPTARWRLARRRCARRVQPNRPPPAPAP
jgi:zinc protease